LADPTSQATAELTGDNSVITTAKGLWAIYEHVHRLKREMGATR